jgi:hypothetical protein
MLDDYHEPSIAPLPRWRRAIRWVGANPAVIVSVVSAGTAVVSAIFAYQTYQMNRKVQERDFTYKELSIRPQIQERSSTDLFEFRLTNVGLGPAMIKGVAFKFGDKCFRLNDGFLDDVAQAEVLQQHLAKHFYSGTLESVYPHDRSKLLGKIQLIASDSILPAKESLVIFSFEAEVVQAIKTALANTTYEVRARVASEFQKAALSVPMTMTVCSLTGYYCIRRRTTISCP